MKILKKISSLIFAMFLIFVGVSTAQAAEIGTLEDSPERSGVISMQIKDSGKNLVMGDVITLYAYVFNDTNDDITIDKGRLIFNWHEAYDKGLVSRANPTERQQAAYLEGDGVVQAGETKRVGYINLYFDRQVSQQDVVTEVNLFDNNQEIVATKSSVFLKASANCVNPQSLPGGSGHDSCKPDPGAGPSAVWPTLPVKPCVDNQMPGDECDSDVWPTLPVDPCHETQLPGENCDGDVWPTLPSNYLDFYDVKINKIDLATLEAPVVDPPVMNKDDVFNYQIEVNRKDDGSQKIDAENAFVVDFADAYDKGLRMLENGEFSDKKSISFNAEADKSVNTFNIQFQLAEAPAEDYVANIHVNRNDESKVYFEPVSTMITLNHDELGDDNGGDNSDDNGDDTLAGGQDGELAGDEGNDSLADGKRLANTGASPVAGLLFGAGGVLSAVGGGAYGWNILRRRRAGL